MAPLIGPCRASSHSFATHSDSAILWIRVFTEQRRVPFEVLTFVDIELGTSSRRRFKKWQANVLGNEVPYLHFRGVWEGKKTLGGRERARYDRGWDSVATDCKPCNERHYRRRLHIGFVP